MVLERVRAAAAVVPASRRTVPGWAVLLAVPVVAAVVLAGVWVTGAELTEDATTAMVLTGAWFALAGGLALLAGLRWRRLAAAVIGTWLVTSIATGGFLLWTSTADRVVDEDVVAVAPTTGPAPSPSAAEGPQEQPPTLLASGRFRSGAHETAGRARLIDIPDGGRVLTLTGFRTDPGPDLRVYLVPGDGSSTKDAVDLGQLRGNKGDQQYDVPAGAPAGGVVVWCRAFSVAFGSADLSS
jgi:hypothetical protein